MKKILIVIVMLLPIVARAFTGEVDIDGVKYSISTKTQSGSAIGLSNPDYVGTLVIHASVVYEDKTCYISSVGGFAGSTGITSVTMEEGITTITENAFKDCTSLAEINLPESVDDIGRYAFDGTGWYNNQDDGVLYLNHLAYCYKGDLPQDAEIGIREGTTIIAQYCFAGLGNLRAIHLPESLKAINEYAFFKCTSLLSISLKDIDLYNYSFSQCNNLKEVSLENVNCIPLSRGSNDYFYHFNGCNSIETVKINCKVISRMFKEKPSIVSLTIGDDVETIVGGAFDDCTGIKNIEFPNSLKHLSGFSGCTGLTSISIPPNVETIGGFAGCTGLTSLVIPSNVKTIFSSAFNGCTGLASLIIPSSVEVIERDAFMSCTGLESVELSEGLKKIGDEAFEYCRGLTTFAVPNSVDTIGSHAFYECSKLKSIILPQKIKFIGASAFSGCCELLSITLPSGLTSIEGALCRGCVKLNNVVIPNSVNLLLGSSFSNCPVLEDLYCYAAAVPASAYVSYGNVSIYNCSPFEDSDIQHATLHVPAQSIESYKSAQYWQDFGEIVAIPDYEAKKCATPRINYQRGQLEFSCDTEGAQFFSEITDSDIKSSTGSIVKLTAAYHISVYAMAPDHAQSDTMHATLCWIDANPSTEGLSNNVTSIPAHAILIQNNGDVLNIQGAEDGSEISVYNVSGQLVGSGIASTEMTHINTSLRCGEVGIVKIGDKVVKVVMK